MKKLFYAAAAAAAVFTAAETKAQGPDPKGNFNRNNEDIHRYYKNGQIRDVRHSMLLTENLWKVSNRKGKQIWYAINNESENVVVKLKGNDYKSFTKAKAGDDREFMKNIEPAQKKKHIAKIREEEKRHIRKDISNESGVQIVSVK